MKVNELRIGNLITAMYEGDYAINQIVVNAVSEIGVNRSYGETEFYIENCEPIPLTEEWLVKCGFIEHHDCYVKDFIVGLYIIYSKKRKEFVYDINGMDVDCNIQYLHQLQNLYFALTGEELKFIL